MIYEKHSYKKNFLNAVGAADKDSARDIALNQLVDAVINDKQYFVDALNKAGIPTKPSDSRKLVLEKVIANIVAIKKANNWSNAEGGMPSIDPYGLSGIGSILSGGASLWDAISNPNKSLNIEKEKTQQAALQAQAAALLSAKKGGLPVWGWIGIAIGGAALITTLIVVLNKK